MARKRERKRHTQTTFLSKDGTRVKSRRGGKRHRKGGRPAKNGRPGSPHKKREAFKPSVPVHVVLRVEKEIGNLRRRAIYKAFRLATIVAAKHAGMRIVHLSIQRTHVHLLVEAEHRLALAAGMKAFQISAAKHINRAVTPEGKRRRRGRVFSDRYHVELIESRKQAHRALGYVLNNWRKHGDDRAEGVRHWKIDPYATGHAFDGWKEPVEPWPSGSELLVVWPPRTWLLRTGWRLYGAISYRFVPSKPVAN